MDIKQNKAKSYLDPTTTNGIQVGTKRYMPPEILEYEANSDNNTFNKQDFKSFINADTYALGLVLWEIASRTVVEGKFISCSRRK